MNDDFAPFLKINGCFIVKNIAPDKKTILIFNYPIAWGLERDLLNIPGVSEGDIRSSLLKGEIQHKLRAQEITVVCSDIDLLQFNSAQKQFLKNAGIVNGLEIDSDQLSFIHREDIELDGIVDDVNVIFTIPNGEKAIVQDPYKIIVYKNGVKQFLSDDHFIAESDGPGTGYDTIIFALPPQTTPIPIDIITADYYVANT